jgi:hypothetical protein
MGMLQPAGEANLPLESLGAQACGQLGAEHLESHWAVVTEVVGDINRRHAAVPQLSLEPIARAEAGLESLQAVLHGEVLGERSL